MSNQGQRLYVLLNPLDLDFGESFELVPGFHLRRPTQKEIRYIREAYSNHLPRGFGPTVPYEYEWVERPAGHATGGHESRSLPPERWRYVVISFSGNTVNSPELEYSLLLLNPPIEIGITLDYRDSWNGAGVMFNMPVLLSYSMSGHMHVEKIHTLTKSELSKVKRYYDGVAKAMSEKSVVMKNLASFRSLHGLPRQSDAMIILLFAILESLVTHKPDLVDSLDSIKHQVRTKLVLLNRRFEKPLLVADYFEPRTEDKVWSLLYDFRSQIAHGQNADMNGTFKPLKSRDAVCGFLEEAVKSLLILGLTESQFLEDLRAV